MPQARPDPDALSARVRRTSLKAHLPYVWSALAVAACTVVCWGLSHLFAATNLVMIYLACVVAVALAWGRGPSILASILSVAAFDFFFVHPYGTFAVADTQYLFTFAVMLVTGLVISELTARVRIQAEAAYNLAIQAEQARLQMETERMRNSLLSAVSHDLRTPLATITGAAGMLAEEGAKLPAPSRQELAESIVEEADRLNRLVANLLDLTRLEAGAIQLKPELQPIEEVIGVVLSRLERDLRDHPVRTHITDDLPPAPIDGLLIQQVLANLLDNAAKFSPPGSAIEVAARRSEKELIVEVADSGPGIPPGKEQQIFEKFYRVDPNGRLGSGIGLAICRGIVVLHGGRIIAENRADGGAVFRFTLPLGPSSEHEA